MRRDITLEQDLPYPPAEVWQALTDPAALAQWLMPVRDFAAVVGTRFQLRAKPMPGWDGVVDCQVLQVEPPRTLAFSWQGSRMPAPTTVRWTLTARPEGGTRLRLDHTGFHGVGGAVLGWLHGGGWKRLLRARLPRHLQQRHGDRSRRGVA